MAVAFEALRRNICIPQSVTVHDPVTCRLPLDLQNSEREYEQEPDTDLWEDHAAYGPDVDDIYGMW